MSKCEKCGTEMVSAPCPDDKPECAVLHMTCPKCTPKSPAEGWLAWLERLDAVLAEMPEDMSLPPFSAKRLDVVRELAMQRVQMERQARQDAIIASEMEDVKLHRRRIEATAQEQLVAAQRAHEEQRQDNTALVKALEQIVRVLHSIKAQGL